MSDPRLFGYLTGEDASYIRDVADNLGFTSVSELVTATLEELCKGGFSAMAFLKSGWHIAGLSTKQKRRDYYVDFQPPEPLFERVLNIDGLAGNIDDTKRKIKPQEHPGYD